MRLERPAPNATLHLGWQLWDWILKTSYWAVSPYSALATAFTPAAPCAEHGSHHIGTGYGAVS